MFDTETIRPYCLVWKLRCGRGDTPPRYPLSGYALVPLQVLSRHVSTYICIDIWPYNNITYSYTLLVTLNNVPNQFSLSLILTFPHILLFLLTKESQNCNSHLKEPFDPKHPQKRYTAASSSHNLRLSTGKAAQCLAVTHPSCFSENKFYSVRIPYTLLITTIFCKK